MYFEEPEEIIYNFLRARVGELTRDGLSDRTSLDSQTFAGDASTTEFTLTNQPICVISITVGGVAIDTFYTDLGIFGVIVDQHMPSTAIALVNTALLKPVILPVPGKGQDVVVEPLTKSGASDAYQIYGQVSMDLGSARGHLVIDDLS